MNDAVAYKILTGDQFNEFVARETFDGAPVDKADGYIHMSAADQVRETLDKHFHGQDNLVIATIDLSALGDAVKWESSRGGALFPHLYAELPFSAVLAHGPVHIDGLDNLVLPGKPEA